MGKWDDLWKVVKYDAKTIDVPAHSNGEHYPSVTVVTIPSMRLLQLLDAVQEEDPKPKNLVEEILDKARNIRFDRSLSDREAFARIENSLAEAMGYIGIVSEDTDLVPMPHIKERILAILKGEKKREIPKS